MRLASNAAWWILDSGKPLTDDRLTELLVEINDNMGRIEKTRLRQAAQANCRS